MYISFINLGCNKNLVDTQFLLGKILENYGEDFYYINDPYEKDVELVFLNTCGFISSGREEMFENIEKLTKQGKRICLLGCAVQYFEKLAKENQLTDSETEKREATKTNENISLLSRNDIRNFSPKHLTHSSKEFLDFSWPKTTRAYTNLGQGYEYLKIAEGCNNQCAFCIIPKIRGKQISLSVEEILADAKNLIKQGTKEIILIAQDTARYGVDLYGKPQLFDLLEELDTLEGDFSYRVLYLYPDLLTKTNLKRLTTLKKFIPYFDIPLQHVSPSLLKSMGRFYDHEQSLQFIKYIRENFKESYIRTNFIIGFPGETINDFNELLDCIKADYFDNIALFEYHDETLAPSYTFPNKLDNKTIRERFKIAEKLTKSILKKREKLRKAKEQIGIIIDYYESKQHTIQLTVRPYLHCPEIDEVDTITIDNILENLDREDFIDIGSKIKYQFSGKINKHVQH